MNWNYRVVLDKSGALSIREVYYNHQGSLCHVEMDIHHEYIQDEKTCMEKLIKLYPDVKLNNRYNSEMLSYNPDTPLHAEWTLK